ncbi:MAG TPA: pyruvate synthase [Dehalococcoidia bacterium]|nr:pyruvate synthase [Dehalococcoidia bacterium]
MLEVRWHGRGGLGAVTSAELLARAAASKGKFTQSFPSFGPERRGAPVVAFLRISDEFIRTRTSVYEPDVVVVIDPVLLRVVDVTAGLKKSGKLVVNSKKSPEQLKKEFNFEWPVAAVDATSIARELIGVPITNTAMIGAFLRVYNVIDLEALHEPLRERFGTRADGNIKAMERAYSEVVIKE